MQEPLGIQLTANENIVYTAIKQEVPRGVILYLPETAIGGDVVDIVPQAGPLTFVAAQPVGQNADTVKIECLLKQAFEYEVVEMEKGLQIFFTLDAGNAQNTSSNALAEAPAPGDENLSVAKDRHGNTVIFTQEPLPIDPSAGILTDVSSNVTLNQGSSGLESSLTTGGITELTDIKFSSTDAGTSTVFLETGAPVEYDLQRSKENEIKLILKNTKISNSYQRPLITSYFNSAVERVLPVQGSGDENNSYILIQLRQKGTYRIDRNANQLVLVFDPVPVAVPEFNQSKMVMSNGAPKVIPISTGAPSPSLNLQGMNRQDVMPSTPPASVDTTTVAEPEAMPVSPEFSSIEDAGPKYIGEKISLDFFETDIKNVFRILRTVSGENFAIDKDVTGNVTLALDQPVPWDQVLDLILKMNGLGKVEEDNIIRIATQATLKKELKLQEEALAAKQRATEQKQKLEPLITEYIAINYSNAEADIKPHLEKFLTPERGQLSVDSRTNMIILTDVREKIIQAKDLIHRLDTVTPQIMIEARVVEVSKDFSREIGIEWGMSSQDVYRDDLGGTYGFDVAMNYPAASDSSLSYTFDRIVGTPFSINAKLTAAEAKGDVKIVSSPRILTLDNKKATITQGLEYPYQVVEDDDVSTEFKDIDLKLEVTPHVTPDRRVSMQLFIEKNDITGFATTGEPVISSNEATTELLVNDGNTIVIGGVLKRTTTEDINGFPFLSDIPILGHLFRSDKSSDSKNELLIFLTPTIVQLEQKMNN
ncbi:type IV pilus secretin PilQ [Desulfocicer vacuolatum]|nr:type IV pilus secretin PilQ [Desulfocicer vacuolatum]